MFEKVSHLNSGAYVQRVQIGVEQKQGECICPLSLGVHYNFVRDGRYSERGWACIPPTSPEMEFLNYNFSRGFGHKLEFCQTRVFYPHFSVLQNAIHEQTRVFLFRRFFVCILYNQSRVCFSAKSASRKNCAQHRAKHSSILSK